MSITPTLGTKPYDLTPPSFSGAGGSVMNQKVVTAMDIYKPNELIEVYERHAKRVSMRNILSSLGFSRATAAPTTGHYEYPWSNDLIRIESVVSGSGAGVDVVVALSTSAMYTSGVTVAGTSRKASYPMKYDIIKFPNGMKAWIKSKDITNDPHRLTLTPTLAADDLGTYLATVVPGAFFISDQAMAEGTGLPDGRTPRVIKYTNEFQIVKAAVAVTGSELTNQTYFNPIPNTPGSFYLKAEADTYDDFEGKAGGALFWGGVIDNVTQQSISGVDSIDLPVKGTEGLVDFATLNGYTDNYTVGAYALSDFDNMAKLLEAERVGTRRFMTWDGIDLWHEKENELLQLFAGSTVPFLQFVGNAAEDQPLADKTVNIGFRGVTKGGYSWGFQLLHEFNAATGAGASGYDYKNWSIATPLGLAMNKGTGNKMPMIGYEYKALGGVNREVVFGRLPGLGSAMPGETIVTENDVTKQGLLSEIAFHGACANHIIVQRP